MTRAFLVVMDACGIGAMPDWRDYGDPPGANTLANVAMANDGLQVPNMQSLGLGKIGSLAGVSSEIAERGFWGSAKLASPGKDTTTGHWELAGIVLPEAFPLFPEGFPEKLLEEFVAATGCLGVLGNKSASGTEIIAELGEKHLQTGCPIVYTSADSVFQIAAHTEVVPLERLYEWCRVARGLTDVSRVIARPFDGSQAEGFRRLSDFRKDFGVPVPQPNLLTRLREGNVETISVGKIADIFGGVGIDSSLPGKSNRACLGEITELIGEHAERPRFVFANLVETDSHYGHRNDPVGFAAAVEEIDRELGKWLRSLGSGDLLILAADHGCDPTVPGTDHTREMVPVLGCTSSRTSLGSVGTRESLTDIGATICEWFELEAVSGRAMVDFRRGHL